MNKVHESGKVTFGQAWKDFWKGYLDFKGISTRAGFWWSILFYIIALILIIPIRKAVFIVMYAFGDITDMTFVYYLFLIPISIPVLAVLARRFRDIGLNNIFIGVLIALCLILQVLIRIYSSKVIEVIVIINDIIAIILLCLPTNFFKRKA